jgi:histone H3/H4
LLRQEQQSQEEPKPLRTVPIDQAIQEVVSEAEEALEEIEPTEFGFSPQAYRSLRQQVSDYIRDLITESGKEARRHQADTVSRSHVQRAGQYLVTGSGRRMTRHLGTFGGLLLGSAIGQYLQMAGAGQFPMTGTLIAGGIGAVGAVMLGFHIAKD